MSIKFCRNSRTEFVFLHVQDFQHTNFLCIVGHSIKCKWLTVNTGGEKKLVTFPCSHAWQGELVYSIYISRKSLMFPPQH